MANGIVQDAQAQLALANEIKDDIYAKIQDAVNDKSVDGIEEFLEDQENLGLTKKDIRELEEILEELIIEDGDSPGNSGDAPGQNNDNGGDDSPGNSGDAPGQNNDNGGDDSPGNSGDAPGQNRGNEEAELPPGFDSASDIGKANGNGQGLGLGKIPPGLAKLFGYDDGTGDDKDYEPTEGLSPGLGNIPPGQLKKFDVSFAFNDKPDDFFENHYEAEVDDVWKVNFDGTNRGNSEGKGMFGAFQGKSGKDPNAVSPGKHGDPPGKAVGKPFCSGKALGGVPVILLTGGTVTIATAGTPYVEPGVRACAPGIDEITSSVVVSNGTGTLIVNNPSNGAYIINYDVQDPDPPMNNAITVTRTVLVGPNTAPTVANTIPDDNSASGSTPASYVVVLTLAPTFDDAEEPNTLTYTVTGNTVPSGTASVDIVGATLTVAYVNGANNEGSGDITITATDGWGESVSTTFTVTRIP